MNGLETDKNAHDDDNDNDIVDGIDDDDDHHYQPQRQRPCLLQRVRAVWALLAILKCSSCIFNES